jgi:diguanylate cyclase
MTHLLRIVLLLLCLSLQPPAWGQAVVEVGRVDGVLNLVPALQLLADPARRLDLQAVLAQDDAHWQPAHGEVLNVGYADSVWWLRLTLHNEAPQPRRVILDVGWPLLDFLDVHLLQQGQPLASWHTGDRRPLSSRAIDARTFAFALDLPAGASRQLVLRLDLRDGAYDVMPVTLWEPAAYFAHAQQSNLVMGLYLGALISIFTYSLLIFLYTRESSILFYAGYTGMFALWVVGFVGYGMQYLWPDAPGWNSLYGTGTTVPVLIFSTLFVTAYLQTRQRAPRLHRALWLLTLPTLVVLLGVVLDTLGVALDIEWFIYLHYLLVGVLGVLYLLTAIVLLRRGYRPAIYFVLGWSCMFAGVLVYLLTQIDGLLPVTFSTRNSIMIGSALEFLMLSLAVGDRFRSIKEAKLEAERQAHEQRARYAARLELEVQQRTRELQAAVAEIANLARTDELTRLLNRRAYNELVDRQVRRAQREHTALALCIIDVDHFKQYNDRYGHLAGDEALRRVADVLQHSFRRPTDFCFRLGGEEFGVLLTGADLDPRCFAYLEQVRSEIAALGIAHADSAGGVLTASFGVVLSQGGCCVPPQRLFQHADEALYRAKAAGRNRVETAMLPATAT